MPYPIRCPALKDVAPCNTGYLESFENSATQPCIVLYAVEVKHKGFETVPCCMSLPAVVLPTNRFLDAVGVVTTSGGSISPWKPEPASRPQHTDK